MAGLILALDQGTTSTRALVFDADRRVIASAQQEFPQHYPHPGWVEHDAEDIWRDTLACAKLALERGGLSSTDIAAIGVTNQRETTVLWDRKTGKPLHNAIVWQDRRTAEVCAVLRDAGHEALVQERTGLLLDPYFSATKLAWLLDTVPGARAAAEAGELAFGTIDTFLLWRLTEGRSHRTDVTNASRTLLYDIHRQRWCPDLLALFRIPAAVLPEVCDSASDFGHTDLFGAPLTIGGMAGDQQAALVGQSCFAPGQAKITYGTGGFMLLNTGERAARSQARLLTTIAYRVGGQARYAMEGSIFVAGAAIKWLRDKLGIIVEARQTQEMAARLPDNGGVFMVPAFVGLGAPHWDMYARGAIVGLTRGANRNHLVRATLESIAFQTRDVLQAMQDDSGITLKSLKVDGGAAANDFLMQFQSDILGVAVQRPQTTETTALGAAFLAGLAVGFWRDRAEIAACWSVERSFAPTMDALVREKKYRGWKRAVERSLAWAESDRAEA